MTRNEWFVIDYGNDFKDHAQMVFPTYQYARSQAGKYPVDRLVLDKDWEEPESEWSTPCDSEARHRPMVEVKYSFENEWKPAILLMVTFIEGKPIYVAHTKHSDNMHWNHCRIHKHEVELIYDGKASNAHAANDGSTADPARRRQP
jgi:hypothetical protein